MSRMRDIQLVVVETQLVSLKTRKKAALGFSMNTDMHVESTLLQKQIEALEKFKEYGLFSE